MALNQKKIRTGKIRIREAKRILTGRISYMLEGSVAIAAPDFLHAETRISFPGADSARFFGVRTVLRQYRFRGSAEKIYPQCVEAFLRVGMRAHLFTAPDALAILCTPRMRHPLVVTLEGQDDQLLLSIYTSRSLFAALNQRQTVKQLLAVLPPMAEVPLTLTPQCVADAESLEGTYAGKHVGKDGQKSQKKNK